MTDSRIAYLDCFAGISGDMLLGALIDAGLPETVLGEELAKLKLPGFSLTVNQRQTNGGLAATKLSVHVDEQEHQHRSLRDILTLLESSDLPGKIIKDAGKIFTTLAQAEAEVHGCDIESVHFHEVGGVDAIVDIVGATIGLDHLGIDKLSCSPLPMPQGWVNCAHGQLPLPAPAVCAILQGVPVYGTDFDRELVTPTGAAIIKTLAEDFGPLPPMRLQKTGYGAGGRESNNGQPNLLRLMIGEQQRVAEAQLVEVIETHLDDWNPEGFPYLSEGLLQAGALDVALVPIQMKKGRPGFLLRVIADKLTAAALKQLIFRETSAIGLRFRDEQRLTLPRQSGLIKSEFGDIRVKRIESPTGVVLTPEYEACREIARSQSIPLRQVYDAVQKAGPEEFREEE